ncbi:MAG: CDP-alcohol phosphatidyltransferase family protein [Anaerolineae bacterium]
MLSRFRHLYERATLPLGRACLKLGLKPDFWTLFSIFASIVAAMVLAQGRWGWGLALVLVTDLTDMLDGAAARAGGTPTRFGTVLDHVCDRYAEFIILAGLMASGKVNTLLVFFAATGMIMASYVRAKAESVAPATQCTVGLVGRQEKLILLMVGLGVQAFGWLPNGIAWALAIIGLASHVTAIQRLLHSRKMLLAPPTPHRA